MGAMGRLINAAKPVPDDRQFLGFLLYGLCYRWSCCYCVTPRRVKGDLFFFREDIQLDLMEFKEEGDEVRTKWKFSALLQLPWRPRLAAAGGTKHVLDKVTISTHPLLPC